MSYGITEFCVFWNLYDVCERDERADAQAYRGPYASPGAGDSAGPASSI